jgi:hypothetical protein
MRIRIRPFYLGADPDPGSQTNPDPDLWSDLIFPVVLRIRIDFNADPDPAFNLKADPDAGSHTNPDPDLWSDLIFPAVLWISIDFNVDPDPAFYLNAGPDPGCQTNPDPDLWSDFAATMKNILNVGNRSLNIST